MFTECPPCAGCYLWPWGHRRVVNVLTLMDLGSLHTVIMTAYTQSTDMVLVIALVSLLC